MRKNHLPTNHIESVHDILSNFNYYVKMDKTSWTYSPCNKPDLPGLKGEMFIV